MNASVLAHHPPFHIGAVEVRPATKTVSRDGHETVVEPRVMQVLVALADAHGDVVSRDDLVEICWDGRIVGDDAINRIMSRLRRLAGDVGHDSFVIETVTKVGYRLRLLDPGEEVRTTSTPGAPLDRRKLIGGLAAGVVAVGLGGLAWRARRPSVPPEARALLDQAMLAFNQDTREGQSQAEGILRQLVADQPRYADAWGALAMTYASDAHFRPTRESILLEQRARVATRRALSLDPDNRFGLVALANARPMFGNWLMVEQDLRRVIARQPKNFLALDLLSKVYHITGRNLLSLDWLGKSVAGRTPSPGMLFAQARALWYAGRLDECDQVLAKGAQLYPTHFAIWFQRFYTALFSNRADTALALALDKSHWPSNIPEAEVQYVGRVAEAMVDPAPGRVDAVIAEVLARAHDGAGHAENSAQFAAALGSPRTSFEILHAYYFGEGYTVPEVRFSPMQGVYTRVGDRMTNFLFAPSMVSLHRFAEFGALTRRLGLAGYWRRSDTLLSPVGVPID